MSVEAVIKNALSALGDPVQKSPFTPDKDNEFPKRYYTFEITSYGENFADNAPQSELNFVMVHFFCPLAYNSVQRVKKTKQALFGAGTTWPHKIDASDSDGQHLVFECEYVEGVEVDGAL